MISIVLVINIMHALKEREKNLREKLREAIHFSYFLEPGLMKMRSSLRKIKTKTCGIDTKKRTLAYV